MYLQCVCTQCPESTGLPTAGSGCICPSRLAPNSSCTLFSTDPDFIIPEFNPGGGSGCNSNSPGAERKLLGGFVFFCLGSRYNPGFPSSLYDSIICCEMGCVLQKRGSPHQHARFFWCCLSPAVTGEEFGPTALLRLRFMQQPFHHVTRALMIDYFYSSSP